ncbi:MAG TPA: gluconate 2-dehydrogenase subunit 3 family protein [Gemmatimonadales bacterium]|nr:gluconate 2-dehydrogenase subunit 3 family protein [Gemmatimonadales bacterium]
MHRRELLSMLGAAVAGPLLPASARGDPFAAGRTAHRRARSRGLQVLDPHQSETVATIAEMIIPATDTPGARAAEVHRFIDLLLAEWAPDDERAQFLQGLADVDARARTAFGVDFLSATEAQRGTILTQLDAEAQAQRGPERDRQPPFFLRMKALTVYGYCTSEIGATTELHYEVIPGSYDGCTDLGRASAGPGDF